MNLEFYRDTVSHHGVTPALVHAAYRAANHLTEVVVLNGIAITPDHLTSEFWVDPTRPPGRLVSASEMEQYRSDPANGLTGDFLAEAKQRGDRCYVIVEDGKLASYGWYATHPTRLTELPGAPMLYFDSEYAYMHNGFTLPEFRGRRLHAIGMAAALAECAKLGLRGLVSYVAASNFASLKSCDRMGYRTFGRVFMAKVGGQRVWRSSPGCDRYRFRVEAGRV